VDRLRYDGHSALHLAALQGSEELVHSLLKLKADVMSQTSTNGANPSSSAALLAAGSGHVNVLEALVEGRIGFKTPVSILSNPNSNGETPAYQAAEGGHANVLRYLWQQKADLERPSLRGATPLYIAAQNNKVSAIRLLLVAQS